MKQSAKNRKGFIQHLFLRAKISAGFTLIEVIMVLFFATALMTVLFVLWQGYQNSHNLQYALARVTASNRNISIAMENYVAQATQVLDSAVISGTNYSTNASSLVLELPAVNTSGEAIADTWDKVAFYGNGSNFYIRVAPAASSARVPVHRLLSDNLASISLTYNNASNTLVTEVSLSLQSQLQLRQQAVTNNLQQNFYLYNH